MNDKELADKVVALGIGEYRWPSHQEGDKGLPNYRFTQIDDWVTAEQFVRDWRVAGALMEKSWVSLCYNWHDFYFKVNEQIDGKSISELPRAIIEAC